MKKIFMAMVFVAYKVITGTELRAYLKPTVPNASQHVQTPLFGKLEGEG